MVLVQKLPFLNLFFPALQTRKMPFTIFQEEKTHFQDIKTRSSTSRNIDIFPKGLTHVFSPKRAIFSTQTRKMSFTIFQNDKMPFQAIKTTSSKCRNIDIFPKWVNPWFWSKNGHFSNLFVRQIQASKISFLIFQDEKTPFQAIKKESSKSQKLTFFQRGYPLFWSKNGHISNLLFQAIQARKMSFTIFQNKKTPFQAVKTRS